jgi:pimeloyl-ACP methyl ester carboxylesterase
MTRLRVNGVDLYYEEHGSGAETILFAHGCLLNCRQFDGQVAALQGKYRCITFDFRGQGQSEVTQNGYDMDNLAIDVISLIEALRCESCHFIGCSMGGFVGMRVAVQNEALLQSLTLVGSSAGPEPDAWRFRLLSWAARCFGMRAVTPWVMPIQFGPKFLKDPNRAEERRLWFERMVGGNRIGNLRAAAGVIRRLDYLDSIGRIRTPTLIVVGEDDQATPVRESQKLQVGIPGARMEIIPNAGHAVAIEDPQAVTNIFSKFVGTLPLPTR